MASVTQRVPNYLGGVSKQPDDKKFPGQVSEALNVYPDPTFGLQKRPGLKFITTLKDGGADDKGLDGEDFTDVSDWIAATAYSIGDKVKNDGGKIYVCDTNGTSAGSGGPTGTGSNITDNTTRWDYLTTELEGGPWFYIHRDNGEKYIGCIKGHGTANSAKIHIWNAVTKNKAEVTYPSSSQAYLDQTAKDKYNVLTVQDTTIVTNTSKSVTAQAAASFNADRQATVRLLGVENSQNYTVNVKVGSGSVQVCDITSNASATAANILADIEARINTVVGGNLTVLKGELKGSLELTHSSDTIAVTTTGGVDGNQLASYGDSINNISQLPTEGKGGRIVHVKNTASTGADDYYAKFIVDVNQTTGSGYWEETLGNDMSPGLTASTMPHELVNTATDVFIFRPITWTDRLVGDDTTNSQPSFVGKTIQQTFFYNNRLGLLSEDNVILSQAGEFYNFYSITAQTVSAADPVDLNCSSIRPAVLHGVIPVASGLILFSANQQFIMYSADGNLSPTTAIIRGLSNFAMDKNIDPVDVGTNINFVSKTPAYSRVFGMTPRGQGQIPEVTNLGKVVDEYIPQTIDTLIASPQNSFIALYGSTLDKVYFYRTHSEGNESLLKAWFSWQLPGKVHAFFVDSDIVYTVVKVETSTNVFRYVLLTANLSATAEDEVIITTNDIKINPYMDLYSKAGNVAGNQTVTYDATTGHSKCYIPYTDIASATPVITIAGDADVNFTSDPNVPTGLTLKPETVGSDGNGTYFLAENIDLSHADVKTNVIVGYTYDYDVTLPKTYFQLDKGIADYTSKLTISRMKFSVGRSSTVGFKTNARGLRGNSNTFEGDGSNQHFALPFYTNDLDDIKVELDGTKTTAFTIASPADITVEGVTTEVPIKVSLTTAPATTLFHAIDSAGVGTGYSNDNDVATTGGSGTGLTVNITTSGGAVTAVTTATAGSGYLPEEEITITGGGGNAKITIKTLPVQIKIYEDNWYDIQPVQEANQYLASDVPFVDQAVYTLPIHQRSENFTLRVFSDSPFPVSLTSMMWEGNYTPRYYRRM